MTDELTNRTAEDLAAAMASVFRLAHTVLDESSGVAERVRDHLGHPTDPANTAIRLEPMERATLQRSLDAWAERASIWEAIGISAEISHYRGASLLSILNDSWRGPQIGGSIEYTEVECGPGQHLRCMVSGIILTEWSEVPVALLVANRDMGPRTELQIEVVAADRLTVDGLVAELRAEMERLNVMRGQTVAFTFGEFGGFGLSFVEVPAVERDQVVLSEAKFAAIEAHTAGISAAAKELTAAGQHVKRGLMFHGPPGTGKTMMVSHLITAMPGRTTIVLSGPSVGALGQAGQIARSLQPATVVIEDIDLVAMDRGMHDLRHGPMLFQLLNDMDGMAADADVIYIVTTNRPEVLEPALAARPGRIDQVIEFELPDADARAKLLELYLPELPGDSALADAIERTAGGPPALVKELGRRVVLRSLRTGESIDQVVPACLDELIEQSSPVLRRSLGVGEPPEGPSDRFPPPPGFGHGLAPDASHRF